MKKIERIPWNKGLKIPFKPRPNTQGKNHCFWKGGRTRHRSGYILVLSPNHPFKHTNKYVFEHRLVIEKNIGRFLKPEEVVHHINGVKDDNRISNLMFFQKSSEHSKHEFSGKPNCKLIGHKVSKETRLKISFSNKGKI